MTITATPRLAGPYIGNGSATGFAFTFKVFTKNDIQVVIYLTDGTRVNPVLDSDYSVTLNPDQTTAPGGTVTYPISGTPLAIGATLTIAGALAYTQTLSLPGGGNFNPTAIENALDRTEIQIQQLLEAQGRAFTLPLGEGPVAVFPPIVDRANRLLGFDADGDFIGVLPTAGDATNLALDLANSVLTTKGTALLGYKSTVAGAVGRTVQDVLRDRVSVRDFGADNTGVADSSAAFALAHAALPATGGEIYIPAGTYRLDSTWAITKAVQVTGTGGTAVVNGGAAGTKLVKSATATDAAIRISGGGTGSKLQGFLIQGTVGNTGDGISIETGRVSLEDINVFAMGQDGVRIGTDVGTNANLWFIKNLRSKNNGRYGLHISDKIAPTLADANGGCLIHADLQSNTVHGCHIENAQLNTFHHMVCQSNGARGLSLGGGADYNIFVGGDFESNGADEINIGVGATGNTFMGGTVTGSLTDVGTGTFIANVIGTNWAGGVQFGNVGSANTKSLDWYEEGSWTPVLTFVTPGNLAVTYTAQVGRYTRVGNLVTVECAIITSAFTHTTASGALQVSGLPFTSQVLTNYFSVGAVQYQGITAATTPSVVARVDQAKTVVGFFGSGSGVNNVTITPAQMPTGGSVILLFTLTYQAN